MSIVASRTQKIIAVYYKQVQRIVGPFGKYAVLLSFREVAEKIDTAVMTVH